MKSYEEIVVEQGFRPAFAGKCCQYNRRFDVQRRHWLLGLRADRLQWSYGHYVCHLHVCYDVFVTVQWQYRG